MAAADHLTELASSPYLVITPAQLEALLSEAETLREQDTGMNGMIRVLRVGDAILIQEKSDRVEYLLRRVEDTAAAERFIAERLEIYDRMWDGCGCKVHHYS